MAQQTAVEFFNEMLISKGILFEYELLEQAKAMEKEQIINARKNGDMNGKCRIVFCNEDAEKYYNETYKK